MTSLERSQLSAAAMFCGMALEKVPKKGRVRRVAARAYLRAARDWLERAAEASDLRYEAGRLLEAIHGIISLVRGTEGATSNEVAAADSIFALLKLLDPLPCVPLGASNGLRSICGEIINGGDGDWDAVLEEYADLEDAVLGGEGGDGA